MGYIKYRKRFLSADNIHRCACYIYVPEKLPAGMHHPAGIVQIVHGMCEYAERYEPFSEYLCRLGFIVCAHDHLGHGRTALDTDELGFFGKRRGWTYLIRDTASVTRLIKNEFPKLPVIIYGHSMGSLVVRAEMTKYGSEYAGIVIEGTVGFLHGLPDAGAVLAAAESALLGCGHHSGLMHRMLNRAGSIGIKDRRTDFDWISRKRSTVSEFIADDHMNFFFTAAGFRDLFTLISYVSRNEWFCAADRNVPVLILEGTGDPVGSYGKGGLRLYRKMQRAGFRSVDIRIYENARHELLNDIGSGQVMDDLVIWINRVLNGDE